MSKILLLFCLTFLVAIGTGVCAQDSKSSDVLHPVVGQMYGQANTVIMWHDINDDGQADYRATYIFKAGKLYQISRKQIFKDDPGIFNPKVTGIIDG